jgi:hypothetical protein
MTERPNDAEGPQQGESASAWAEGVPQTPPPSEYHEDDAFHGCLLGALIAFIIAFALAAILLSDGYKAIGGIQ